MQTHDPSIWIQAVRTLKPTSARGIDAISSAELQMLPHDAICDLGRVLVGYKDGFPPWLMIARTFAVPKTVHIPTAADIRPITVLAQTYRLWAKVICKQILDHFSKFMPAEIWGLLSGRGPFNASYQLQLWLETQAFLATPTAGLVLDLVKCFNSIHRSTAFRVLRHLNIPDDVILQWSRSLANLTRIWSIDGWESHQMTCSHGFPEGDIFSVVVMVALAHTWSSHLKACCHEPLVGSYADNWCLASTVSGNFLPLISSTMDFVNTTMMAIDWHKTWIWATSKSLHDSLKAVLRQLLPAINVNRLHTATDLGCQMTYSGPPRLGRMRKRFRVAKHRCQVLSRLPHDIRTKCHLARASIVPAAMYGVEMIPIGEQHLLSLRQQLVTTVLGPNHSRSSAIAMQLLPGLTDPCLQVVLMSLQAARRYLVTQPEESQQLFYRMLAVHCGSSNQCRGPVGCLKNYLQRLGWNTDRQGNIHVTAFVKLPLLTTSHGAWCKWANLTFQQQLFVYYVERKALRGCPAIDVTVTKAVLQKFESRHFIRLVNEISGGFQTAAQKSKWDPTVDLSCSYCPAMDSRYHRMFECPATQQVREQYPDTIRYFLDNDDNIHELPVLTCDPQSELLQTLHWMQPCATFPPDMVEKIIGLASLGCPPTFYTDGSCQHPQSKTARFASFSVVLDLATDDADRKATAQLFQCQDVQPQTFATLLVSRCPGDQRIGRAELYAITCILEHFPEATIFSDSACSIAKFEKCQAGAPLSHFVNSEDFDLVSRIHHAIRPTHHIVKVKAHVDIKSTPDPLEAYHQLGNDMANSTAIQACLWLHRPFVLQCQEFATLIESRSQNLKHLYDMLLLLQEQRAILNTRLNEIRPSTETSTCQQQQTSEQQLGTWLISNPWLPPAIRVSNIHNSSWGRLYGQAMQEWMALVKWPNDTTCDQRGITWLELSLAFSWWTGYFFPVPRKTDQDKEILVVLANQAAVETHQIRFSDLAAHFAIFYDQVRQLVVPQQWPTIDRGLVRSLYNLGAATFSSGFKVRPQYPGQNVIVPILRDHYRQQKATSHAAIPNIPLSPRWPVETLRADLVGTWIDRGKNFSKEVKKTRRFARDVSQRQLSFGHT